MTRPALEARNEAMATLAEVETYLAEREDVIDGDEGQPAPNVEMNLLRELRAAIRALSADRGEAVAALVEVARELVRYPTAGAYPDGPCLQHNDHDDLVAALAALDATPPSPAESAEEMSPEFTDTARAALLWVLWHHQGGSSPVGQAMRQALGMGQHEHLSPTQLSEAKRWAEISHQATVAAPSGVSDAEWILGYIPVNIEGWKDVPAGYMDGYNDALNVCRDSIRHGFAEAKALASQPQPGRVEGMK